MTTSDVEVKPVFSASYNPYAINLDRYDVSGPAPALKRALKKLRAENPRGDPDEIKDKVLFLMANTKRRDEHDLAEHLLKAGLCSVAADYPVRIVSEVIGNWHKREGREAIFTPVRAELYRAPPRPSAPDTVLLEREIERLINEGGNP